MGRLSLRFAIVLVGLLSLPAAVLGATPQRPNVLFIAVDDLKPTIGCYGDRWAKTPHIDRLAARGTLFERAYCMQAVCSPSRNGVLTGLRPQTLQIYDLGTNFRQSVPHVVTLPQHFKSQGWTTEALGKIFHVGHGNHEDPASWSVPHWKARTVHYLLPENAAELTREQARFENKQLNKANKLPRGAPVEAADVTDDLYADGQIALEAIQRLRAAQQQAQPFFLAVGFLKPHLPFCAPQKYWDLHDPAKLPLPAHTLPPQGAPSFASTDWGELRQYQGMPKSGPLDEADRRRMIHGYYAATSYMDAQLGRVLDELDRLDLADKTIVVLWGDHGWHLGDHGMWCKHTNYEQATHAPLIVAAPGQPTDQRSSAIVEFVDIYPTLCDLAGIDRPPHLQGDSLAHVVRATANPHGALQTDGFALHVYPRHTKQTGALLGHALRSDRWRYVEWQDSAGAVIARELYDLDNDPDETVNRADDPDLATVIAEHAARVQSQLAKGHPAGLGG